MIVDIAAGDVDDQTPPKIGKKQAAELGGKARAISQQDILLCRHIGGLLFEISFDCVPKICEYFVHLDRVWFWVLGEAMGTAPHVRTPTNADYTAE